MSEIVPVEDDEIPKRRLTRKMSAFLQAYVKTPIVSHVARGIGISSRRHYEWLKTNSLYAEQFELARQDAIDELASKVLERTHGSRRKKFTPNGAPIIDPETGEQYEEIVYDDSVYRMLHKLDPKSGWTGKPGDSSASANVNLHTPGVPVADLLAAVQQDPDYLEFLRHKAMQEEQPRVIEGPQ